MSAETIKKLRYLLAHPGSEADYLLTEYLEGRLKVTYIPEDADWNFVYVGLGGKERSVTYSEWELNYPGGKDPAVAASLFIQSSHGGTKV